jgi:hypothetical protein
LFRDEIIDIDFGAIDAFTNSLNAHIEAQQCGRAPPQKLEFPSHILKSNHATFIDNQLLLGDYSINAGDGSSGINVQLINPVNTSSNSSGGVGGGRGFSFNGGGVAGGGGAGGGGSSAGIGYNFDNYSGGFSRSNSFGSIVDVQTQPTYSTAKAASQSSSNNNYGAANTSSSHAAYY